MRGFRWVTRVVLSLALAMTGCGKSKPANWNTALTPATHEVNFPIASGIHANIDCQICHGDQDTFKQYTCIGCHEHERTRTDAVHVGLEANYQYSPTACFQCHPTGAGKRFDHVPYFPIREGSKHAGITCASCHLDPAVRKQVDCLTCHPTDPVTAKHDGINGYNRDSNDCIRCHGDSQVDRVVDHLPFRTDALSMHYKRACTSCHPAVRPDKPFAADFKVFVCLECHPSDVIDPTHNTKPTYKFESLTCVQAGCHPTGQRP